jgi:hypothetical protein
MNEVQLAIILGFIRVNKSQNDLAKFLYESKLIEDNFESDIPNTVLYVSGFICTMETMDSIDIIEDPYVILSHFARTFIIHRGDSFMIDRLRAINLYHNSSFDDCIKYFKAGIGYLYPSRIDNIIKNI